jgi:ubiquinone/menaquinone biosynthesis C-methylase UbiE
MSMYRSPVGILAYSHYNPRVSRQGYRNLLRRYERYAPNYDHRFARYSERTLSKALELVPNIGGNLLDVACGTGLFEMKLREHRPCLRVTGIDLSPQMLDKARERLNGEEDGRFRFAIGTAERLSEPDESSDVVVCNNALHLVQDAPAALREFHRVLKPGGRVVIVDWCIDFPQVALMDVFLRVSDRQVRNIRGVRALSRLLTDAHFEVIHSERFMARPLWGLMVLAAEKTRPVPGRHSNILENAGMSARDL